MGSENERKDEMENKNGIIESEFTCQRDGLAIRGKMLVPSDAQDEKLPVAVVSHGFMSSWQESYPYAQALADSGYAAFCFDFCGGGPESASEGSTRDMSPLTEVEDLKAVVACARGLDATLDEPVLLAGCSQGGFVSALTAAKLKDEVRGLALIYPAFSIPDDSRHGRMLFMEFDPENVPDELQCGPMALSSRYVLDVQEMDTYAVIAGYTGPVLIVHGDNDQAVDISYSYDAVKAYEDAGASARLEVIEGGEHGWRDRQGTLNPEHLARTQELVEEFAKALA